MGQIHGCLEVIWMKGILRKQIPHVSTQRRGRNRSEEALAFAFKTGKPL